MEKHASFPCTKLRGSDKAAQLTVACRSTDRLNQKPNQPRLLSTSKNSWHFISSALWQLRATFATSQSCRKWAIASGSTSQICLSPLVALIFSFSISNFLSASLCCFPNTFVRISTRIESGLVVFGTFLCLPFTHLYPFWKPRPQISESRRTIPVSGKTDLYQNVTGRRWFFPTCCRWCSWPASLRQRSSTVLGTSSPPALIIFVSAIDNFCQRNPSDRPKIVAIISLCVLVTSGLFTLITFQFWLPRTIAATN